MIKHLKKLTGLNLEKAQTMVEFAIVFPIVLLITYGMIEFGRMMFIYAAVTGAAREGARYGAAVGDIGDGTPYYKDCDGIITATKRGAILTPINTSDITIKYDNGPTPTKTWNTCPPVGSNGLDPILRGYRIVVHVEVNFEPIINFLGLSEGDCSSVPKGPFCFRSENARTILVGVEIKK